MTNDRRRAARVALAGKVAEGALVCVSLLAAFMFLIMSAGLPARLV